MAAKSIEGFCDKHDCYFLVPDKCLGCEGVDEEKGRVVKRMEVYCAKNHTGPSFCECKLMIDIVLNGRDVEDDSPYYGCTACGTMMGAEDDEYNYCYSCESREYFGWIDGR
jgi:hypothetical protein